MTDPDPWLTLSDLSRADWDDSNWDLHRSLLLGDFPEQQQRCDVRVASTGCQCPKVATYGFMDEDDAIVSVVCDNCKATWDGHFPRYRLVPL